MFFKVKSSWLSWLPKCFWSHWNVIAFTRVYLFTAVEFHTDSILLTLMWTLFVAFPSVWMCILKNHIKNDVVENVEMAFALTWGANCNFWKRARWKHMFQIRMHSHFSSGPKHKFSNVWLCCTDIFYITPTDA